MQRLTTLLLYATAAVTAAVGASAADEAPTARMAQASAAPTFASLDANHDGKISLNEASANDAVFVAFKKLDGNRDGELTPAEFAAYSPSK